MQMFWKLTTNSVVLRFQSVICNLACFASPCRRKLSPLISPLSNHFDYPLKQCLETIILYNVLLVAVIKFQKVTFPEKIQLSLHKTWLLLIFHLTPAQGWDSRKQFRTNLARKQSVAKYITCKGLFLLCNDFMRIDRNAQDETRSKYFRVTEIKEAKTERGKYIKFTM